MSIHRESTGSLVPKAIVAPLCDDDECLVQLHSILIPPLRVCSSAFNIFSLLGANIQSYIAAIAVHVLTNKYAGSTKIGIPNRSWNLRVIFVGIVHHGDGAIWCRAPPPRNPHHEQPECSFQRLRYETYSYPLWKHPPGFFLSLESSPPPTDRCPNYA